MSFAVSSNELAPTETTCLQLIPDIDIDGTSLLEIVKSNQEIYDQASAVGQRSAELITYFRRRLFSNIHSFTLEGDNGEDLEIHLSGFAETIAKWFLNSNDPPPRPVEQTQPYQLDFIENFFPDDHPLVLTKQNPPLSEWLLNLDTQVTQDIDLVKNQTPLFTLALQNNFKHWQVQELDKVQNPTEVDILIRPIGKRGALVNSEPEPEWDIQGECSAKTGIRFADHRGNYDEMPIPTASNIAEQLALIAGDAKGFTLGLLGLLDENSLIQHQDLFQQTCSNLIEAYQLQTNQFARV